MTIKPKLPDTITFPVNPLIGACLAAGISVADAAGPARDRETAYKRFHVMWLLRQGGLSFVQIGKKLNRDHTSVMTGCRRWEELVATGERAA